MQVIAALTIWTLLACFLIFPLLGFRPLFHRTAGTLLAAEGIALMMWGYGSEGCQERPCGTVAEVGHTAASIDVPVLTVALVALTVARGVRAWRRAPQTASASEPRVSASRGTGRRPAPSSERDTSDRAGSASSCASSRADRSGRA